MSSKVVSLKNVRVVVLERLAFFYLKKYMHDFSNRYSIRFFPNVHLKPACDDDFLEFPELKFFRTPKKEVYLLRGEEDVLGKCTNIINKWYSRYRPETVYAKKGVKTIAYVDGRIYTAPEMHIHETKLASRDQLNELRKKFAK